MENNKKYLLINTETQLKTICSKVVVDGVDYYVSDEEIKEGDWYMDTKTNTLLHIKINVGYTLKNLNILDRFSKIIATNDQSLVFPKVLEPPNIVDNNDKIFSLNDVVDCMNKSYGIKYFSEHKMIENLRAIEQPIKVYYK